MNTLKRSITEKGAEWLLAAVLFLLPWQTRWIALPGTLNDGPWEYGTVSLYGIDILIIGFFLFAYAHLLQERKKITLSKPQLLALLLLIISFLSIAFAGNKINGLFWWVKLAEGILLFLTIPQLRLRQRFIAAAFVLGGVLQATIAYLQFLLQQVNGIKWLGIAEQLPETLGVVVIDTRGIRILRSYGALPHPNILAGFLIVAILFGLSLYYAEKKMVRRLPWLLSLSILSIGLWTTFSRQAIFALGVAITIFTLITFIQTKKFPKRAVVGLTAIVLPLLVFSATFPHLMLARTDISERIETRSINERTTYLEESTELLKEHWITGVGIGNYTAILHSNNDTKESYEYQPVHNIYILLFTEIGIFGILTFIFWSFMLFSEKKWKKRTVLHSGLALSSLFIIGIFDHYLWSLSPGILLFWITAALFEHIAIHKKFDE